MNELERNIDIWNEANAAKRVSGTLARLARKYNMSRQRIHQIITAQDKEQGFTPNFTPEAGYPCPMAGWYTTEAQKSAVLAYCAKLNIPVSALIRVALDQYLSVPPQPQG